MKKKDFVMMASALLLCCGFAVSCGSDDDPQPNNSEQSTPITLPEGTFSGWTEGSNPYATYIPSAPDSIVISKAGNDRYNVSYVSATHGLGTITNVQMTKNDTAFVFEKPVDVSKNVEGTDFVFSQVPDSIIMPNRNPQGGASTWKTYPATLEGGYLTTDGKRWEFTFKVYCNVRYIHQCIVREGAIGNRRTTPQQ